MAQAIVQCWGSAYTSRSLIYRINAGLSLADIKMAVVVQQMVEGEISGVLFTANPSNGDRSQSLLTAAWGIGEGVVSGECDTDEYIWSLQKEEISCRVADKDIKIVRHPISGVVKEEVPKAQRDIRCLNPAQVEQICREGNRIAKMMGTPQDIEWTLCNNVFYLLQSRPITALPTAKNRYGSRVVWDNSNIQESYCGVTTPLTFSFASKAYATVYRQTMRVLGLPEQVVEAHRDMLDNMLGIIGGQVYYNINNWYKGLLLLPSFGQNKDDMEKMMGLEEPVDLVQDQVLTFWEKVCRLPRLFLTLLNLIFRFFCLKKDVANFLAHFQQIYSRIDRKSLKEKTYSQLLETIQMLDQELLQKWHTPIVNDFYVMMMVGKLRRQVEKSDLPEPEAITIRLLSGGEGIESTEPTRVLMRMAALARSDEHLHNTLKQGEPLQVLETISTHFPRFMKNIDDYIEKYGDRTMGELKLETVSLRQDPGFVIKILRNFLDRPDLDPDKLAQKEKGEQQKALVKVKRALSFFQGMGLQKNLKRARQAVKNRENMRLARTRMFGLYRDIYLALGAILHRAGRLQQQRDIFYLTIDEIKTYGQGRSVSANLQETALMRRAEYLAYQKMELPNHFETLGPVYHGNDFKNHKESEIDTSLETLKGTGCYPGQVKEQVRLLFNADQDLNLDGKILTTLRTDPGWAPLFPSAGGILVERGSTLSHSAVLARELGIPAIVGIKGLTKIVQDGEKVRIDGEKGIIQRLEGPLAQPPNKETK